MMHESEGHDVASQKQREQMLKLVTRGFYNELTNYGVRPEEILRVASHLLDSLMQQDHSRDESVPCYNHVFTLDDVEDEWDERGRLTVQQVSLRPLADDLVTEVAEWLSVPVVRDSFVPRFPGSESELRTYFASPGRSYFGIYHEGEPVGVVGAENIDEVAGKLEMKKLVGRPGLRGKGIGKRATFAFLYHAFVLRNMNKVYIHSCDINIRNISLNSRFGFEVEGVFLDEFRVGNRRRHVVRMALFRSLWLEIFGGPPADFVTALLTAEGAEFAED